MAYPKDRPNPPPHVLHLLVHGIAAGQRWANSFWIRNGNATTPNQADITTYTSNIVALWWSSFGNHVTTGVTVEGGTALYWDAVEAVLGADVAQQHIGNAGTEGLPNNCSTCISWKVQAHYKGGHPRTYLPPTDIANRLDGRLFKPSYTADVAGAANNFLDAVNASGQGLFSDAHLGTVSFVLRKAWRTPPLFRDYIPGQATVDQRIDSMRRRLGRDL